MDSFFDSLGLYLDLTISVLAIKSLYSELITGVMITGSFD